jgi:hypothetical protein
VSLNFGWPHPANTPAKVQECANKTLCYGYTINDGEVARKLLSLGVRGVFSDCPDLVMQALLRYQLETSNEKSPGTSDTVAGGNREGERGGGVINIKKKL